MNNHEGTSNAHGNAVSFIVHAAESSVVMYMSADYSDYLQAKVDSFMNAVQLYLSCTSLYLYACTCLASAFKSCACFTNPEHLILGDMSEQRVFTS